jgi:hypothetical protein
VNASRLVYPLRRSQLELHWWLVRNVKAGDRQGMLAVEVIRTLQRCEAIARSLSPFDPTGL